MEHTTITVNKDELRQLVKEYVVDHLGNSTTAPPNYIRGIKGLATALGCSYQTAHALKASGKIPYSQHQRTIIFDLNRVLTAIEKKEAGND